MFCQPQRREQFGACVIEKMMTYAVGRGIDIRCAIDNTKMRRIKSWRIRRAKITSLRTLLLVSSKVTLFKN